MNESSGGVGLAGLLGIAFIILKLCGVIAWSWWWVLAPFWIPLAIVIVAAIIFFIGWLIVNAFDRRAQRRRIQRRLNLKYGR